MYIFKSARYMLVKLFLVLSHSEGNFVLDYSVSSIMHYCIMPQ